MIEFTQIIGRGTRLYDGKDSFTILDFVKPPHHFSDPESDGEPIEPEGPEQDGPKPPANADDQDNEPSHAEDGAVSPRRTPGFSSQTPPDRPH